MGSPSALKLAAALDFRAAAPLRNELIALRGRPVEIDGGEVERIGAQCVQVLVSAARTWADDGVAFAIVRRSEEMVSALRYMGVHAEGEAEHG